MTLRYLVDTDWIINYLSGHELAIRRLDDLKESGLAISIVSLAELFEGIYYSSNPQGNERYLMDFLRGDSRAFAWSLSSTPPTFSRT